MNGARLISGSVSVFPLAFALLMGVTPALGQQPSPSAPKDSPGRQAPANEAEDAFRKGEQYSERKNYKEAMRWYRIAAEKGHLESQNNVGMFYLTGMGVPKDVAEGVKWLRKAADRGHEAAQRNMGIMYLQGIGVPQDRAEAIRWLRKAAEKGDDEAKSALKMIGEK